MSVYRRAQRPSDRPRALVRRPGVPGRAPWFVHVIIIPLLLAALWLLGSALAACGNALAGDDAGGRVAGSEIEQVKRSYRYTVFYRYETGGREYEGRRSFDLGTRTAPSPAEALTPGAPVRVRHFGAGPARYDELLLPGESPWHGVGGVAGRALFLNAIVGCFAYLVWFVPARDRWLYRRGAIAEGRITGKRTVEGRATHHYVDYDFTTRAGEKAWGMIEVRPPALWNGVAVGQTVTVLHHPKKAKPNLIYELGAYAWADEGSGSFAR